MQGPEGRKQRNRFLSSLLDRIQLFFSCFPPKVKHQLYLIDCVLTDIDFEIVRLEWSTNLCPILILYVRKISLEYPIQCR